MQAQEIVTQEWKDVPGYEGLYQVSSLGNVYSMISQRELIAMPSTGGYWKTALTKSGVRKTWRVHRLVAAAFLPHDPLRDEINHINGNKADNSLANLEWCSSSENKAHAVKMGLFRSNKGDNHSNRKISQHVADEIKALYASGGIYQREIASRFGLHQSAVSLIITGKRWQE